MENNIKPRTETEISVLVLGVGNILLMDEGAGVWAVEMLRNSYDLPPEVEVIDGGTMGIELLDYLMDRSHLFIIDVVKSGKEPGTVSVIELDDPFAYRTRISPHQLGLNEVLGVASVTGDMPGAIKIFGIEPEKIETGCVLSEKVAGKLEQLVGMVKREIESLGLAMDRRLTDSPAANEHEKRGYSPRLAAGVSSEFDV